MRKIATILLAATIVAAPSFAASRTSKPAPTPDRVAHSISKLVKRLLSGLTPAPTDNITVPIP